MVAERKNVPDLVTHSAHSSEAVESYLCEAKNGPTNKIEWAIKNNSSSRSYRGYSLIGSDGIVQEIVEVGAEKRPIWFFYSGTGTQWPSCAKEMMKLHAFRQSISRCADVLRPKGIDLVQLVTDSDESTFENIQNAFISIVAVQVALTDLLAHIGITPDGIVGVSLGEFGSAYADGCFTTEQTMLAAYWRGQCLLDTDLIPGLVVSVALTPEEVIQRLPDDVYNICHIGSKNVVVSGKIEAVAGFSEQLKAEGISTRAIDTVGIPFHTKYLSEAANKLRKSLEEIIPSPKKRSKRWISTSVRTSEWNTPIAQYCSSAYHVNNFLSPVYVIDALQHVPQNAICIEIAPHRMFQRSISSLSPDITYLPLMLRSHPDSLSYSMNNIGKLYNAGAELNISKLYD